MLSFWEKEHFQSYDIAIVGAGIVGLSTAISLKESDKSLNIVILERGVLPTGASSKNAGFACIGSFTEIKDDLKQTPMQEVLALIQLRYEGLALLKARTGIKNIDYQEEGSHELLFDNEVVELGEMDYINEEISKVLGKKAFSISNKKFAFGKQVKTVVENHLEGSLNTGLMMRRLLFIATQMGIEIKTGYEVKDVTNEGACIQIRHHALPLTVEKIAYCTNAFTNRLFPALNIAPGRGMVMVTKPIKALSFKGIFHFDAGYYYFRNYKNRIIFGGGRSIDKATETTSDFGINQKIQFDLEDKIKHIILPNQSFEIDYYWSGIMAFGSDKKPIIKKVKPHQFVAAKLGGMGVAIGSKVGAELASLIIQDLNKDVLL